MSSLGLFCDQTEELVIVEITPASVIRPAWPTDLDGEQRRNLAEASDWLLNAAGAGRERLDQALRARWPGDRRGLRLARPLQSAYWVRMQYGLGGGASTKRLLNGRPVTIDDSHNNTSISRTSAGNGSSGEDEDAAGGGGGGGFGQAGRGGGRGNVDDDDEDADNSRREGGGGRGGGTYSDDYVAAVVAGDFSSLRAGSSGGDGGDAEDGGPGGGHRGAGSDGIVRASLAALALNESRKGANGGGGNRGSNQASGGGGAGSGGLVIAITPLTLSGKVDCNGGIGGRGGRETSGARHHSGGDGGHGGDGRAVLFYGDANTATVVNAVLASYQLLALPGWTDAGHSGTGRTDSITGLTPGVRYQFRVRAENSVGEGPWSAVRSATTSEPN
ncbi:MAG: fibronectin type III domain-containing protein [Chloroflexi bacterium]|nr:fibronectin type III domain-containing protein [Chloroflexota bacterium]